MSTWTQQIELKFFEKRQLQTECLYLSDPQVKALIPIVGVVGGEGFGRQLGFKEAMGVEPLQWD